jgi:hypothetical protein
MDSSGDGDGVRECQLKDLHFGKIVTLTTKISQWTKISLAYFDEEPGVIFTRLNVCPLLGLLFLDNAREW